MFRSIALRSVVGLATIAAASLIGAPTASADPISDAIGALFSMIDTGSESGTSEKWSPDSGLPAVKMCTPPGSDFPIPCAYA